jgi:meiotic recombination protein DMC1
LHRRPPAGGNLRHRHQGTRRDARGLFPLAARPHTAGADPPPSFCSPAQKVKEAGHCTVKSLLTVPKKCLIEVKGLSDAKVDKMLESAMKLLRPDQAGGFVTASEWIDMVRSRLRRATHSCVVARPSLRLAPFSDAPPPIITPSRRPQRKDTINIRTGAETLDGILGGGVPTRSITEIFGEWRCGKTQLCHTLAVTTQLPLSEGGGCAKVAWIDTEGTFKGDRIVQIAERFNLMPEAVLDNIIVARTFTHEMMSNALVALAAKLATEPFKLLVIDSIMAHFRVDFIGRGELSERQQRLGQFLSRLNKMADEFNVAVVYTNQVQADPSGMAFAGMDPKKAVGGHVLAHASHVRLSVRKGRGENRVVKVVDAPNLKEAEAEFAITDGGIVAAEA